MPIKKLRQFLDQHHVKYVTISHSPAFTAQETAASAHVSGKEMAKTVMVKVDGTMSMVVLPASYPIEFDKLKEAVGGKTVELATETEFQDMFPDCELGAMPPFGNLYGMDVYSDEHLKEDEEIVFNAGSHAELIRLAYRDFESLVHPTVARVTS
jgi:Ala-tRNA(Pro) deacylase